MHVARRLLFALAAVCIEVTAATVEPDSAALAEKADAWVTRKLSVEGSAEVLVVLRDKADLSVTRGLRGREEKGRFVAQRLQAVAAGSQAPLLAWLRARGIEHRAFWIANMVWVRVDAATAAAIAKRPEVERLAANPAVRLALPEPLAIPAAGSALPGVAEKAVSAIEWGVAKIRAPEVWAAGFRGEGIVIAGADTGVEWTHPALKSQYRGWNGGAVDH
ncbi:MAG: peptidase S8, partial [Betaproteobacteria bacterium]